MTAYQLPADLWRQRVLPFLTIIELLALRSTSSTIGASIVTAILLLHRIDGSLARHALLGLIDMDRTHKGPLLFSYLLRVAYVLDQGGREWRVMGTFIRLAVIHGLTPNGTAPLVLSAEWLAAHLPTSSAFHQLPLMLAIYRLCGQQLRDGAESLALQPEAQEGRHRIGQCVIRVVSLADLPVGHSYRDSYSPTDPAIFYSEGLSQGLSSPSFSSFLFHGVCRLWGQGWRLRALLWLQMARRDDHCSRALRTANIDPADGMVVDYCTGNIGNYLWREVIVSGFRPGETVAAHLTVSRYHVMLFTTESATTDNTHSLDSRFPVSMPRLRAVLRHCGVEQQVISRGEVRV
ncbi:unnamed protein product [Vitrella brassicaformis CCMP3155]|uniref:Uncharacterized protein n=3 Tax=Vitrella brassicaformis TaxID=1169539 RepID=A0A0G4FSC2_VITBC|nr:unnamed protein product [Vitrella brassicaformis CCMP3155]|mmetsp:Transcript_4856/g.13100  ORF Transcript_4856/g.13100 Transcript_4856/m.13100 type:complete len:348 (+) Transcript_4856:109-1152(+)|eukprot:CEM17311.1 unnamed protein product [Vitrella brassicaformis CCMP3155]